MGLRIGSIRLDTPVVLAPMAGVTNAAFRGLCRRYGDGLFVSEMTSARGLVERDEKSFRYVRWPADDSHRSVQLYGVDPETVGAAVRIVVDELGADHVDLNFGCPVPKVTRKGGGAALPAHPVLFGAIVDAAVRSAGAVPVTVKMRMGLDDEHLTALTAARAAEDAGVAAITLHARTAAQHYSGHAHWDAIAELKAAITTVPVLGNGDIWQADDAVRMMDETGCDGVVIGRGCLGRPWFFAELQAALSGRPRPAPPTLDELCAVVWEHAQLLADADGERSAVLAMRKHVGWYFHDAQLGGDLRRTLVASTTLTELGHALDEVRARARLSDQPPRRRGPTSGPRRVVLPDGWLEAASDPTPPRDDVMAVSG
ncbi:MAG TPA: tRNA dihydrouridine synthase DusB [Acidimicrobiales bacterium]|nr:tRNA dihydrouridine synthase DusB [Acidimicrobiales bacterium]